MKTFEKLKLKFKGNTIALGIFELSSVGSCQSSDIPVERDSSGIPIAWRIFRLGENSISQGSDNFTLEFTSEMFDQIIAYFAEKGAKIPLDSKHFLYYLAEKLGVDESAVLKFLPDGRGTFGFASLEKRSDGLWVRDAEYVPLARQLMAEHIWRYFSPVVRGLVDGRLRVTSVAFVNEPALNNLDAIAASAEKCSTGGSPVSILEIQGNLDALAASAEISRNTNPKKEKNVMKKLFVALAGLLGMDSISLGADGDASADVVTKVENLKTEVTELRGVKTKVTGFIGSVRDKLALGADADLNAVEGRILALCEKAGQADELKTRVDALALSAEKDKLEKLTAQGKAEGKLSAKLLASDWFKKQDSISLAAFLKDADQVIPLENINKENLGTPDAVVLSAEDKDAAKLVGITDEAMLAAKKAQEAKKAEK